VETAFARERERERGREGCYATIQFNITTMHATENEEAREREQCNDECCSFAREVGSNGNHMTTLLLLGGSNK